jgi:hypothetical protein
MAAAELLALLCVRQYQCLAVMVNATLPVMLFTRMGAPKVEVAIIVWPVGVGILLVLLQRSTGSHRIVVPLARYYSSSGSKMRVTLKWVT